MQTILSKLKNIGGKEFISILTNVIAVTAFLMGLDFFVSSPSLKVTVNESCKFLDRNLLYNFYNKNDFNIPQAVKHTLVDRKPTRINGIGVDSPLIKQLKFHNPSQNPGFFEAEAKKVEKEIVNKNNGSIYVFHPPSQAGVPVDSLISDVLPKIKKQITPYEYYQLSIGIKSSIKYLNAITIKNDGDIELKNIAIKIPFPLSHVYGNREETFVEIWPNTINAFHSLDIEKSSLKINLPRLHEGTTVSGLYLFTKENPISENEILYSYDKVFKIRPLKIVISSAIVLIVFLTLHCFWANDIDLKPFAGKGAQKPRTSKQYVMLSNVMNLPTSINEYLHDLLQKFDSIHSIWLIGSRINGNVRPDSDWDFLIFANKAVHDKLQEDGPIPSNDISIMVVIDNDRFGCPWPRKSDGAFERGSLSDWKWSPISESEAKYEGCKELPDGRLRCRWEKAIRIF